MTLRPSPKAAAKRRAHVAAMKELRPLVFARDGYRCQAAGVLPGECDRVLAAHHRYRAVRTDTMENLITICRAHHNGGEGLHTQHVAAAYAVGLLLNAPPTAVWRADARA